MLPKTCRKVDKSFVKFNSFFGRTAWKIITLDVNFYERKILDVENSQLIWNFFSCKSVGDFIWKFWRSLFLWILMEIINDSLIWFSCFFILSHCNLKIKTILNSEIICNEYKVYRQDSMSNKREGTNVILSLHLIYLFEYYLQQIRIRYRLWKILYPGDGSDHVICQI